MRVFALIPAAGMGSRMQAGINKQYLCLGDQPILARTLAIFEHHPSIDQIVVVTPAQEIPYCQAQIIDKYQYNKVTAVVAGGPERQDSVRLGLAALPASNDDLVLIHDGVRPFLPATLLDTIISATTLHGACLTAVPAKDTIKQVQAGMVEKTLERHLLWQAQTPQSFRYSLIQRAHQSAATSGFRATDDASLLEALGLPVAIVPGDYRNIKITTPEDLIIAHALLEETGGSTP